MDTDQLEPLLTVDPGPVVGSFRNLRGAALAVERLRSSGFSERDIDVRPVALSICEPALADVHEGASRVAPAVIGFAAALLAARVLGPSIATVLAACAAGAIAGCAANGIRVMRRRSARAQVRRAASRVGVDRFEIICREDADRANHVLASWWDPDARPAPRT